MIHCGALYRDEHRWTEPRSRDYDPNGTASNRTDEIDCPWCLGVLGGTDVSDKKMTDKEAEDAGNQEVEKEREDWDRRQGK